MKHAHNVGSLRQHAVVLLARCQALHLHSLAQPPQLTGGEADRHATDGEPTTNVQALHGRHPCYLCRVAKEEASTSAAPQRSKCPDSTDRPRALMVCCSALASEPTALARVCISLIPWSSR